MNYQVQFAITKNNSITKTLRVKVQADEAIQAAQKGKDQLVSEEKMQANDKYQLKVSII
jgi:hypothetical protein